LKPASAPFNYTRELVRAIGYGGLRDQILA
jgi:hypothetical protein